MKRIIFLAAIAGLLLTASGCSNGFLRGGLIGGGNDCCGSTSSGLFSGGLLPTNFLQDGPVRQWLRGDACDSCNIPAGQITYDSGFDSSCVDGSCGGVTSPVYSGNISGPIVQQPVSNYYPSYNEGALPVGSFDGGSSTNMNGISESEFFGGMGDNIELPPLSGN